MYPYGTSTMTFHRPLGAGVTYEDITITMNETSGTITVNGPTAINYRLRVKSFLAPTSVTNATGYSYDSAHKVIIIDKSAAASFTMKISNFEGYSLKPVGIMLKSDRANLARCSDATFTALPNYFSSAYNPDSHFAMYDVTGRMIERDVSGGSKNASWKNLGVGYKPYIFKIKE
jgi:hypothetical protein